MIEWALLVGGWRLAGGSVYSTRDAAVQVGAAIENQLSVNEEFLPVRFEVTLNRVTDAD